MNDLIQDSRRVEYKYQRAQTLMQSFWGRTIVSNSTVYPIWIQGTDSFWYERDINPEKNSNDISLPIQELDREYRLVNAKEETNKVAFDHHALALALSEISEKDVDESCLPIANMHMALGADGRVEELRFIAFEKSWIFYPLENRLCHTENSCAKNQGLCSPNQKYLIFVRNYNLWVEVVATAEERQLTDDGEEHYSYSTLGNAWGHDMPSDSVMQARWSDDSRRVFTVQRDCRQVRTTPVVEHVPLDGSVRPKVRYTKVAMQGDTHVPEYRLVCIDVETGAIQPARYPSIPIIRNSYGFFDSSLGWWGLNSRMAYFVDLQRDYKAVRVIEFDSLNGATRVLFEEESATHINLMVNADEYPMFVPLPDSNELIWFSERSGWGHLYLYDLTNGVVKNTITSGKWVVRDILSVDTARREVYIQTMGRHAGIDPYYRDVIRVGLDTGVITTVISGDYDVTAFSSLHPNFHAFYAKWVGLKDIRHARSCAHNCDYILVTCSRSDTIPKTLLLDRDGVEVMTIETCDLSVMKKRVSPKWRWPEPVKLLAADQKTELYGLVYRPSDFDPKKTYPVIDYAINSPDLPSVPKGSFSNDSCYGAPYLEASAMAELGFIVIHIDGRGTSYRHKAFQDECYGCLDLASCIDDHVVGIQQLASRYPYLDLHRVGIYCSMGGAGGVQGLLQYPEFYKVGALAMPMHDGRLMPSSMWADMYEGLSGPQQGYQYPEEMAENLQGKLLLCHGMLDDGTTPPAITFRMVEALQKANKDFDLLMLPNVGHSKNSYMIRRIWDYFVRYLQGTEPPKEFKLTTARDL